jgi:hypothetical protein
MMRKYTMFPASTATSDCAKFILAGFDTGKSEKHSAFSIQCYEVGLRRMALWTRVRTRFSTTCLLADC